MIAHNHGHIVNIVSRRALSANPFGPSYSSSTVSLFNKCFFCELFLIYEFT